MHERSLLVSARRAACVVALLVCTVVVSSADAATMTVAWDPNPEPIVVGYRVYVGSQPGVYTRTYDVGRQTVFAFVEAVAGLRYYFAVAAYAPGPILGVRSVEVTAVAPLAYSDAADAPGDVLGLTRTSSAGSANVSPPPVCMDAVPSDCYVARVVADGLGQVDSPEATSDGLLFIEDGRRVRVVSDGALLSEPALELDSAQARLTLLAVDPAPDRSQFVFVGETETHPDGERELSVRRYRSLQNRLGEGARVVSGLTMTGAVEARLTLDTAGRIYVAMPADESPLPGRGNPYGGFVLRFDRDGAVPAGSPGGSPVFSQGFARPTGLAWDVASEKLWLSGGDSGSRSAVAQLEVGAAESREWPRLPRLFSLDSPAGPGNGLSQVEAMGLVRGRAGDALTTVFFLASGRLYRAQLAGGAPSPPVEALSVEAFGHPVALAAGARNNLYVVFRRDVSDGRQGSYSILELDPVAGSR